MKISIVIPAYNEERRIGRTVEVTSAYLDRHWPDYEIIVVNNRSTDGTRDRVQNIQYTIPRVTLIDEPVQGKGAAVKAGMRHATRLHAGQAGHVCVFMDADNSTPVSHLEIMLPYLEQGHDVVIGSIAVGGARILSRELWYRRLFGRAGNWFIRFLAVPGIHDTQRGFKIFTARAAQDIFPRLTIAGWGFDIEVLALARKRGYRIREVPVTWDNSSDSHITWQAYPQVLWQTVKVWWRIMRGGYG